MRALVFDNTYISFWIWQFSKEAHADNGTPFEVKIETPCLDLKATGQFKRLIKNIHIGLLPCGVHVQYL